MLNGNFNNQDSPDAYWSIFYFESQVLVLGYVLVILCDNDF